MFKVFVSVFPGSRAGTMQVGISRIEEVTSANPVKP